MNTLSKKITTLTIAMLLSGSTFAGTSSFTAVTPEEGFKRTHIQVGDFQRFQVALSEDFQNIQGEITANGDQIRQTQTDLNNLGATVNTLTLRVDRLENKEASDFAALVVSIGVNTSRIDGLVDDLGKANKRIDAANTALISAQNDYNNQFSTTNQLIQSNKTAVDQALADAKANLVEEAGLRDQAVQSLIAANTKLNNDITDLKNRSNDVDLTLGDLGTAVSNLNDGYQSILTWRGEISDWKAKAISSLDDLSNEISNLTSQQNTDRQAFTDGLNNAANDLVAKANQIAVYYKAAIAAQLNPYLQVAANALEAKANQIAVDYKAAIVVQSNLDLQVAANALDAKVNFLTGLIYSASQASKDYTNTEANKVRGELSTAIAVLQSDVTKQIEDAQKATKSEVTEYSDKTSQKIVDNLLDIASKLNAKIAALYEIAQPTFNNVLNTAAKLKEFDDLELDLKGILGKLDAFDGTVDSKI